VARSQDVTEYPQQIKLLGETLILFRDGSGCPGLLYPRCAHRGTNLLYGKTEPRGIRCPYHGWLFTVKGRCVERACEPGADARNHHVIQPWYPVIERYGLVFTYMGPGREPVFPRFEIAEDLEPDEMLVTFGQERMTFDGPAAAVLIGAADYNWWNFHDNVMDPYHLYFLHSRLNGIQLVDSLTVLPTVHFERTADGVLSIQHRQMPDGHIHQRTAQTLCANMNGVASLAGDPGRGAVGWTVPADDTSFRAFWLARVKRDADPTRWQRDLGIFNGWGVDKPFREWSLRDHQDWQSDYVCQRSQGPISLHSEEHLSRTDIGIAMTRRFFREQTSVVQKGGIPVGVTFDEPYLVVTLAGNAVLDAQTMQHVSGFDGSRHARSRAGKLTAA
jgi:phenylpropionate dioxygenase-like ring-hydroxylating dioxygenase large terminal subunit